jgi:electron transfer flavoprotein beta subunit
VNTIVCVKLVGAANGSKSSLDVYAVNRDAADLSVNPFDLYAVEEGLRIKEQTNGKTIVVSMGIPAAADKLKEMIAMGADEAILLSDAAFAGSDALATAYVLSQGIRKISDYGLVICGKQAIDGDTAQVGPALAELLGIPHVTNVRRIEEITDGHIRCQRMTDDGYEILAMSLPAVISVVKEINDPRLPSLKGMMRSKKAVIPVWSADEIVADASQCGLCGSPTRIVSTFVPVREVKSEMIEGEPDVQANTLVDRLLSRQIKSAE